MPTLLVFAHPQCPCTNATIEELAQVLKGAVPTAKVFVCFFTPPDSDATWAESVSWNAAAELPGVIIFQDKEGKEASRFHAATSGRTLFYGANGQLLFDGGITEARGHTGANVGRHSLISLLSSTQSATATTTPVFGCEIQGNLPEAQR